MSGKEILINLPLTNSADIQRQIKDKKSGTMGGLDSDIIIYDLLFNETMLY